MRKGQYAMGEYSEIKISYYSGTESTAMVAKSFMQRFEEEGCSCSIERITNGCHSDQADHNLLLLLFPVHAFNAPEPVYKWIENLKPADGVTAAVISVSGGGEISPNTACRFSSIKRLNAKGYRVVYERMIVMPCNFVVATKEVLSVTLLEVLPKKVDLAAKEILSGIHRKTTPILADRLFSKMGELEKPAAKLWGRGIRALDTCKGCGWCAKNCPSGNITMRNGKPQFSTRCHLCLKCIYGCDRKALVPGIGKFFVIKEGYNLDYLLEKAPLNSAIDIDKEAEGYLWSGLKKYLLESE